MKTISIISEPSIEPVTLAEVKTALRVDSTADDAYLTNLIKSARKSVELYLGRALITQTVEMYLDACDFKPRISLIGVPIQSITQLSVYDEENTESVIAGTDYQLISDRLVVNGSFGYSDTPRRHFAVRIEYVAGYGDNTSDVPEDIRQAVISQVSHMYECKTSDMCSDSKMLLDVNKYRSGWVR